MKYNNYLLALCILATLTQALPPAAASGTSVDMPIAESFPVSGAARATDNVTGEFSPGPGKIDIARDDRSRYVRLPLPARNGSRLLSLDDHESGIIFRNNTMLLPLYSAGEKTGTLILATDNLTADSYGYAGMITGIQVDSGEIATGGSGQSFTAGILMSLSDLPAGASYRVAFADDAPMTEAIPAELEASGLTPAVTAPAIEVSASNPAAGNMVSYVIVTVETEGNWTGPYGDKNISFYRFAGGRLSRLRFSAMRTAEGGVAYQAISPGTGLFAIVAAAPRDHVRETVTASSGDVILLGGLLAVLVIALGVMVRRVIRR